MEQIECKKKKSGKEKLLSANGEEISYEYTRTKYTFVLCRPLGISRDLNDDLAHFFR